MASNVSICSNALLMLGAKPIASFNEPNDRTTLASNLYPGERRAFLRLHPWNPCMVRKILAPEAAKPAFGYSHQFLRPAGCIRIWEIGGEDSATVDHKVEGGRILFNGSVLPLRYVADTPEDRWDDAMVHAMTLRMAALMAYTITGSAAAAQGWREDARVALRDAKTADGQEDPPQGIDDSPLLDARYPGGGY